MTLDQRIARLVPRAIPLSGIMYRSASPKYASAHDMITGEGSARNGGRWNPQGLLAIYGSLSPQTALEESIAFARYFGFPVHAILPRTFVAIQYRLSSVLDLTSGSIRRSLGLSEKRMLDCDWRFEMRNNRVPLTQRVANAAYLAGFEALLTRSAAHKKGQNVIVFAKNLYSTSSLEILSRDELP